jgi:hypothetical protein
MVSAGREDRADPEFDRFVADAADRLLLTAFLMISDLAEAVALFRKPS